MLLLIRYETKYSTHLVTNAEYGFPCSTSTPFSFLFLVSVEILSQVGLNYDQLRDNLPSPQNNQLS
ncbi:hypothetical protein Golax_014293 [Gossypium laxum]|uniref:Uncharacterized protein n=1 Tax=Gossypium laxum TaxID=34288 RepID=A0A7J8ZVQ6_9ROSI|nr:hypothetical protein [Gossypium laxum]